MRHELGSYVDYDQELTAVKKAFHHDSNWSDLYLSHKIYKKTDRKSFTVNEKYGHVLEIHETISKFKRSYSNVYICDPNNT